MKINKSFLSYQEWFDSFSNNYYENEEGVAKDYMMLKIVHTKHVVEQIERIAKSINLSDDQIELAKLVALLHDVGRFPQIHKYKIDNDLITENHALLGINVIKEENVLNEEDDETKNVILKSIEYHNIKNIPADEKNEDIILFSKLIRDADKVDIYRVVIEDLKDISKERFEELYSDLSFEIKTSDKIYYPLKERKQVDRADLQTIVDQFVIQLSWIINDINFKESMKIIKENKYIDTLHDVYEWDDRAEEIFDIANKIMEESYD